MLIEKNANNNQAQTRGSDADKLRQQGTALKWRNHETPQRKDYHTANHKKPVDKQHDPKPQSVERALE
jgi:hypothetical protein